MIKLAENIYFDETKPYSEQSDEVKAYLRDYSHYDEREYTPKIDSSGRTVKELTINLESGKIVCTRVWVNDKPQPDEIVFSFSKVEWLERSCSSRVYISYEDITKQCVESEPFRDLFNYVLSPPEGVILPIEYVTTGMNVYFNFMLPEHAAIIEEIETKRVDERSTTDAWEYDDRPLRIFLSNTIIGEGIVTDPEFLAVVSYATNPPEGIEIPKVKATGGYYVYMKTLLDTHRAILERHNIVIETK